MNKDEDLITIKIHGSERQRQKIVNRICQFMSDYSVECLDKLGKGWFWEVESSREPDIYADT